ncbi:acVLRF1 family peptidyl-tRNA hydrolase [Microlunatus spumicola]|uniref:AcVLRF1 family peptidyl-tRNA hydrolase n=1 Tax=Microlunatus spumicola TaxID=81499 RepID=A0ABP6X4M2_9ACTN
MTTEAPRTTGDGDPGRVVLVAAERLSGWVARFETRHGVVSTEESDRALVLVAGDGARAVVEVPFPPLPEAAGVPGLVEHALADRTVGAVLVRRGGYAVGWFEGRRLVGSKVGSSYVQGTTKAGGWSQQRYARRRANQTRDAYAEAAGVAATLLLPHVGELTAVVGGGDAAGVHAVLADPRLSPLRALLLPRVLPTVDPRLRVLQAFGDQLREVRITLSADA